MTTGQWRGHLDNEWQYWQVTVQGVSESGDAFGIVLADGIGGGYGSADRATEDHINVNGVVYKLDGTRQENRKDQERIDAYFKENRVITDFWKLHFFTIDDGRRNFSHHDCKLSYDPEVRKTEGVNQTFTFLHHELEIGSFDFECRLGEKLIQAKGVKGILERVWYHN